MCLIFLPAKAGWTGLEPLRFFTGTVGTLREKKKLYKAYGQTCCCLAECSPTSPKNLKTAVFFPLEAEDHLVYGVLRYTVIFQI